MFYDNSVTRVSGGVGARDTRRTFTTDNYERGGDKSGRRRTERVVTQFEFLHLFRCTYAMAFGSGLTDKLLASRCLESTYCVHARCNEPAYESEP